MTTATAEALFYFGVGSTSGTADAAVPKGRRRECTALLNATTSAVHEKCHNRTDQEYDKQYLRDSRRSCSYTAEAKQSGNQSDNEKYHSVMKHGRPLFNNDVDSSAGSRPASRMTIGKRSEGRQRRIAFSNRRISPTIQ